MAAAGALRGAAVHAQDLVLVIDFGHRANLLHEVAVSMMGVALGFGVLGYSAWKPCEQRLATGGMRGRRAVCRVQIAGCLIPAACFILSGDICHWQPTGI